MKLSAQIKQRGTLSSSSVMKSEEIPPTLEVVLDSPELRKKFRHFLQKRLANESLLFYESIELYEQIQKETIRNKAGKQMVAQFILEHSECWVNIPASVRDDLLETSSFTPETFEIAKKEVYKLMNANFFEYFTKYLQGMEIDSTPKLSFDSSFSPAYYRSMSFEQLADSLGENLLREDDSVSEKSSGKISNQDSRKEPCQCPKENLKEGEHCCEKMKVFTRIQKLKYRRFSKIRQSLTPTSLRRKVAKTLPSSDLKSKTQRKNMFSLFSKRPSSTRSMALWAEVGRDEDLKYQL